MTQRIPRKLKKLLKAYIAKHFPAEYGKSKQVRVTILSVHHGVCGAKWRVDRSCTYLSAYNTFAGFRKKKFEFGDGTFLSGEELEWAFTNSQTARKKAERDPKPVPK